MAVSSRAGSTDELLERAEELDALDAALDAVCADGSRGCVVLVSGEAGAGKTSLLTAFVDRVGGRARVLSAACDPLFTPRPLGPLLDVATATGGELLDCVQRGAKPHDVSAALLRELDGSRPTVLMLEDVHWADEATLDVIRLLAARSRSVPVVLVLSYRDDELGRTHPLRRVLGELPGRQIRTRIMLPGLSREAVALLAGSSGLDADELFERTAGNPFFVRETLAAGSESVPPTVRDAVLARASRLSPAARGLLDAVAVVPQRCELWLAEALVGQPLSELDECISAGMLRSDARGTVAFRHELARIAVEESLAPDRAAALHRSAFAALTTPSRRFDDLARIVHHADAAHDGDAVLRYAPAAAEQASAVGAHREACDQLSRALRVAGPLAPDVRADLLERYAEEGFLTDIRTAVLPALDDALAIRHELGDSLGEGRLLCARSRLLGCAQGTRFADGDARRAITVLEQLPASAELARAYAELSRIAMLADDGDETLEWGTRAIAIAEQTGDQLALVQALNNVGVAEVQSAAPAWDKLERSLALARDAGFEEDAGRAYLNMCACACELYDWARLDEYADAGAAYCHERGLEAYFLYVLATKGTSELLRGRWTAAADTATTVLAMCPPDLPAPRQESLLTLGIIRARRDDPGHWPLLDDALAISRDIGDLQFTACAAAIRAEAHWLHGRPEAIDAETAAAFAEALTLERASYVGALAGWRARAGLPIEVPDYADPAWRAEIAGDAASAAAIWHERGCPYEAALAAAASADLELLQGAHESLVAMGARPAAVILARRLRELGARIPRGPRPATARHPAGLTTRQVEVLALLGEGLRNAEIAQRLVVSEKTVDHHVSAILAKLGVRSRAEATLAAARLIP